MGINEDAHNVRVVGSGLQAVVLGHGFGTDQSVWRHLVPHLVDNYRVVLFDNMGAGTTNPDYVDFERYSTLDGYAHDLIAILEELQVKSCIFVGHSLNAIYSGLSSLHHSTRSPLRLSWSLGSRDQNGWLLLYLIVLNLV